MEKPNLRVELRNLRNRANKIVDYCRNIEFKNINFKNINMKMALTNWYCKTTGRNYRNS